MYGGSPSPCSNPLAGYQQVIPAGDALDLDEIAGAKVRDAGGVERDHCSNVRGSVPNCGKFVTPSYAGDVERDGLPSKRPLPSKVVASSAPDCSARASSAVFAPDQVAPR